MLRPLATQAAHHEVAGPVSRVPLVGHTYTSGPCELQPHTHTMHSQGDIVLEDELRQLTQKHTCCHSLAWTQHKCTTPPRHAAMRMPGARNAYCQTPRGCLRPLSIVCELQRAANNEPLLQGLFAHPQTHLLQVAATRL